VSFTRTDAEVFWKLLMTAATNPGVAALLAGPGLSTKQVMRRSKNAWKNLDKRITKRDEAQRAKELGASGPQEDVPTDDGGDVPLF
jgi:hypothetical protein